MQSKTKQNLYAYCQIIILKAYVPETKQNQKLYEKININMILEFAKCIYVLEYLKALENIQYQDSGPCANSQTYPHSFLPLHCCLIYFVYVLLSLSPLT